MSDQTSLHSPEVGSPTNGLFRLPQEVRDSIYWQLLRVSAVSVQNHDCEGDLGIKPIWEGHEKTAAIFPFPVGENAILRVSKQISEEALNVLYGHHPFIIFIDSDAHMKLLQCGVSNIRRIRNVRLAARPTGIYLRKPLEMHPEFWTPLLAGLTQLCIVLQQPKEAHGYNAKTGLLDDMQKWKVWIEPILQHVAKNMPPKTVLNIDDDNLAETEEVVQRCFPSGYTQVQTVTGDRLFRRGELKWLWNWL